jgi:SWI/SNF-related matrix-associated actin-dependent regulator of chromatin subfamily A member 5
LFFTLINIVNFFLTYILYKGHKIKNQDALVSHTCSNLKSVFKVILTGTPVQNNLTESWSLLNFLSPKIFTKSDAFDSSFQLSSNENKKNFNGKNKKGENDDADDEGNIIKNNPLMKREMLSKAHYLMRIFILRRLKVEVEQKLPKKLETKINCPMSEMQRFWIQRLLLRDQSMMEKIENNKNDKSYNNNNSKSNSNSMTHSFVDHSKLKSLITQLRKAANHPFLFHGVEQPSLDGRPTSEIVTTSGKMTVLERLLHKLHANGHRVVIFSQYTAMLDIIADFLHYKGYQYCQLDGRTNRVMREVRINMFNKVKSKIFAFCLSTRAGGEGINLFTADTVILFDR